jgi:hypothetical protein
MLLEVVEALEELLQFQLRGIAGTHTAQVGAQAGYRRVRSKSLSAEG